MSCKSFPASSPTRILPLEVYKEKNVLTEVTIGIEEIPGPVDMVKVYQRSVDLEQWLSDVLLKILSEHSLFLNCITDYDIQIVEVHLYIYIHIHVHTNICTYIHVDIYVDIYVHVHDTNTCTCTCTCGHTNICNSRVTYTFIYMYTCCTYTVIYTQVCELEWIVAFLVVAITESSGLVSPI